jgi:hypothetical protein
LWHESIPPPRPWGVKIHLRWRLELRVKLKGGERGLLLLELLELLLLLLLLLKLLDMLKLKLLLLLRELLGWCKL